MCSAKPLKRLAAQDGSIPEMKIVVYVFALQDLAGRELCVSQV